jgi:hypothetical protein
MTITANTRKKIWKKFSENPENLVNRAIHGGRKNLENFLPVYKTAI